MPRAPVRPAARAPPAILRVSTTMGHRVAEDFSPKLPTEKAGRDPSMLAVLRKYRLQFLSG